jgi:6-phosphogluconate dehydrogenase
MHHETADIGLIGLAVMGQNLVLNLSDHGACVAVYNRTKEKVEAFTSGEAKGKSVVGCYSMEEFFKTLKRPKKVLLMVKAGEPVDLLIEQCLPFLSPGDVIIDGGNSHFSDTKRRELSLKEKEINFLGIGISGGEEGARFGPSIMPGGNAEAWPLVKDLLTSISAKSDDGKPCCQWVGPEGSGHFVKMVHNGIEYGDMQLICEAYDILKQYAGLTTDQLHEVFSEWNKGELNSYLIEITSQILAVKEGGEPLVDKVLDVAGQKGTGLWTAVNALTLGVPVSLIAESVFARCLSSLKEERVQASQLFKECPKSNVDNVKVFIDQVKEALFASKIVSYTQGFMLLKAACEEFDWKLDFGQIALMWRGGCIIRSQFLDRIEEAYTKDSNLPSLFFAPYFEESIKRCESAWRQVVATAALNGIPVPCFSAALSFYDGYRRHSLPANLLQAQRDFFGAHTYERTDKPRGEMFHTNWIKEINT